MTSEQQLNKLVDYLINHLNRSYHYYSLTEQKIIIDQACSLSDRSDIDGAVLTLNRITRTASLYTFLVSHHNSDHYDCKDEIISWDKAVEFALEYLKKHAIETFKKEQEEQEKQQYHQRAINKLNRLLED